MSRFNNNIGKNSAEALSGSYGQDHAVDFGKPIRIYKFRKLSGIIRITPQGEQTLRSDPASFTQLINLYTSKEPVVVLWEGSTSVSLNDKDEIVKTTNVGKFYDLYSNSSFAAENKNDKITFVSNEFTTQSLDKSVELTSYDWIPEDVDISDYVYLILDKRAQSYQWLEITSVSPNWNEEQEKLENVNIDFANIGTKYAESGKNILDFFQFGAIGEGYAFPKQETVDDGEGNETVETTVDYKYLNDVGISTLQFDYMCGAADSSIAIYGRKTGFIDDNGDYILDKPHRLFLHEELFPLSSKIFFNKPNVNSFVYEGAKPTVDGIWKSYKDVPSSNNAIGQYNILETKEVLTGFEMDRPTVLASNPVNGSYTKENWNNGLFIKMKQAYNFDSVVGIKSVGANPAGWADFNYTMFLNFNSYVNFSSDTFNFDAKETKKYKLTDVLGMVGGIVSILIGGLNVGWTAINSLAPNQPMNLRFPCISYTNGIAALSDTAPLPCDVFLDDKQKQVIPVNTNVMTSHRYSLTDLIYDGSQVRAGADYGKGQDGVWYTKYIGQTKFEDGTNINTDGSPFEFNPVTTNTIFPAIGARWIVDAIVSHVITNADVRLTAYVENYNEIGETENVSVYQSLFSTASKAINDIRLWGGTMKFNYYDRFNSFGGVVKWPELALPPPAPVDRTPIYCPFSYVPEEVEMKTIASGGSISKSTQIFDFNYNFSASFNSSTKTVSGSMTFSYRTKDFSLTTAPSLTTRPVESLKDLQYVYISVILSMDGANVENRIYAEFDPTGDDDVQIFTSSDLIIDRTPISNVNTTGGYSWKLTAISPPVYGNLVSCPIWKTSNFFKMSKITVTRNIGRKTVTVKFETTGELHIFSNEAGSQKIPGFTGSSEYLGASAFGDHKFKSQIKSIGVIPR